MAKGNLFLGTASGKVGDIVTYRKHGAQITRAYNPSPDNPRTDAQMIKRVRWASLQPSYNVNKVLIGQTFTELVGNTSAQRQYYKANHNKTYLFNKSINEYYKNSGYFAPANYVVSKGSLSWFPETLIYKFEEAGGQAAFLCLYLNNANINAYLDYKAKEETSILLSLGELIGASLYNTPYWGERVGIVTTRIDKENLYNTWVCSRYNYYETTNALFENDLISFRKSSGVWSMDAGTSKDFANFFDKFTLYFDMQASIYVSVEPQAEVTSCGFASFRVRPTDKAVSNSRLILHLDNPVEEYLETLNTDEYIQTCIDSYRDQPILLLSGQAITD